MNIRNEKTKNIFLAILLMALTAVPVSLCFNNNVWLDEAFSLRWSTWPLNGFGQRLQMDVCPLYLLMLRFVLGATGGRLLFAKLFSVLAVFLMLVTGVTFVRKRFGYSAMFFYCLFILFTPMMLKKSVEVRMYTWAFFGVTFSAQQMFFLLGKDCGRKRWILFTVGSLASAYFHYFAVLTLAFLYVGLLGFFLIQKNWKQVKNWAICAAATCAGYMPWVPVILKQTVSGTTSWIPASASKLGIMRDMFRIDIPGVETAFIILLLSFLVFGAFWFWRSRTPESYWMLVCMATVWGVLVFGLIFEKIYRPILVDRYLMIPLCVSILGASCLCRHIHRCLVGVLCIFFVFAGIRVYPGVYAEEYNPITDKTLEFAGEHIAEGDILLYNSVDICSVVPYYFRQISEEQPDVYEGKYDYVWYFDTGGSLDLDKLGERSLKYVSYGAYGLDNVNFEVYYIYRSGYEGE